MDLSEGATYHGKLYPHGEVPEENHSVETVLRESRYPNAAYNANVYSFPSGEYFEINDDVQHLMGALGPLPDGRATVLPAHTETLESCYDGKQAVNFTITADETILMPHDTPNAESKLAGQYDVETASVDVIRASAGEITYLTGRVD